MVLRWAFCNWVGFVVIAPKCALCFRYDGLGAFQANKMFAGMFRLTIARVGSGGSLYVVFIDLLFCCINYFRDYNVEELIVD